MRQFYKFLCSLQQAMLEKDFPCLSWFCFLLHPKYLLQSEFPLRWFPWRGFLWATCLEFILLLQDLGFSVWARPVPRSIRIGARVMCCCQARCLQGVSFLMVCLHCCGIRVTLLWIRVAFRAWWLSPLCRLEGFSTKQILVHRNLFLLSVQLFSQKDSRCSATVWADSFCRLTAHFWALLSTFLNSESVPFKLWAQSLVFKLLKHLTLRKIQ